jgi:predicted nucleic acid-binding protein
MPSDPVVLVDTGPLVALFDRDDAHHTRCVEALRAIRRPLITVWPVLTEAAHLLSFSFLAQDSLWELLERGGLRVADLVSSEIPRLRALMRKYSDHPMDLADAALVRVAEREGLRTIFTLDHTDFGVYRLPHGKTFFLIPESLQ